MYSGEQINNQPNQNNGAQTNNIVNSITDTISSMKNNFTNAVSGFTSQPGASTDFLSMNTIFAKFAFLIVILVLFLFFMNLGIKMLGYIFGKSENPYLVYGTIAGNVPITISQNPELSSSVLVQRSNNENTGIEFTWAVWLYINDIDLTSSNYHNVFNKGDNSYSNNGIANINNAPGLYLSPNTNSLFVVMDTVNPDDLFNTVEVTDIPLKKWVHVALRMENVILDVYVNGTISARLNLQHVPKQNYMDVNVCQNGGFVGQLSNLQYFASALDVFDINAIVNKGPNVSPSSMSSQPSSNINTSYLSKMWYATKL